MERHAMEREEPTIEQDAARAWLAAIEHQIQPDPYAPSGTLYLMNSDYGWQPCALCGLRIEGIPDTLDRGTLQPIHAACGGDEP